MTVLRRRIGAGRGAVGVQGSLDRVGNGGAALGGGLLQIVQGGPVYPLVQGADTRALPGLDAVGRLGYAQRPPVQSSGSKILL